MVKIPGSIGTIKEINNGKIRCIPFTDFSFNYPCDIFYDFTGAFYVTAKKGLSFLYFYLATNPYHAAVTTVRTVFGLDR